MLFINMTKVLEDSSVTLLCRRDELKQHLKSFELCCFAWRQTSLGEHIYGDKKYIRLNEKGSKTKSHHRHRTTPLKIVIKNVLVAIAVVNYGWPKEGAPP